MLSTVGPGISWNRIGVCAAAECMTSRRRPDRIPSCEKLYHPALAISRCRVAHWKAASQATTKVVMK